jgi:hypothetical protein
VCACLVDGLGRVRRGGVVRAVWVIAALAERDPEAEGAVGHPPHGGKAVRAVPIELEAVVPSTEKDALASWPLSGGCASCGELAGGGRLVEAESVRDDRRGVWTTNWRSAVVRPLRNTGRDVAQRSEQLLEVTGKMAYSSGTYSPDAIDT